MLSELQQRKLIKLFSMYDANNDGVLVCQDFENIVKKLADLKNLGSRSPKYKILLNKFMSDWNNLKGGADTSRDKKVSLEEWLIYHDAILQDKNKYNNEVQSLIALVFEAFDKDGDGKINQQEWGEFLSVYNVSPVYAPLVFPKLDTNQDGFLNKEEFLQLIHDFYYSHEEEAPGNSMFGPY